METSHAITTKELIQSYMDGKKLHKHWFRNGKMKEPMGESLQI